MYLYIVTIRSQGTLRLRTLVVLLFRCLRVVMDVESPVFGHRSVCHFPVPREEPSVNWRQPCPTSLVRRTYYGGEGWNCAEDVPTPVVLLRWFKGSAMISVQTSLFIHRPSPLIFPKLKVLLVVFLPSWRILGSYGDVYFSKVGSTILKWGKDRGKTLFHKVIT